MSPACGRSAFAIPRDDGDVGDLGDRRARAPRPSACVPSATDPTPLEVLLKTKAQPQFERPVKRLSMPFFSVFLCSNPAQFQLSFSVFTVRSAEGYKCPKPRGAPIAAHQIVILNERCNLKHQFQFEAEGRNPERSRRGRTQIGVAHLASNYRVVLGLS